LLLCELLVKFHRKRTIVHYSSYGQLCLVVLQKACFKIDAPIKGSRNAGRETNKNDDTSCSGRHCLCCTGIAKSKQKFLAFPPINLLHFRWH